ncbi:MAG: GNAT family N-acetyltransferase [Actinomycetota bacterium]|nr:GNAT family N-acetyltransferase [Actinomycetota bacterium]
MDRAKGRAVAHGSGRRLRNRWNSRPSPVDWDDWSWNQPELRDRRGFLLGRRAERRRGVATRSVQLISAWAFEKLALERLELLTHTDNVASQAVAEACGYTYEGTLRSHRPFKEGRMDSALFSLLPGELGRVTQDR